MKKFDQKWFEYYNTKCSFDDIDYLKIDPAFLSAEKEKFLSGNTETPTLKYEISTQELSDKKKSLLNLKETVTNSYSPEIIKDVYAKKIEEQLLKISLLEKTIDKDDLEFFEISKKIYGTTNKEGFSKAQKLLNQDYRIDNETVELLDADKIKDYLDTELKEKKIPDEWSCEISTSKLVVSVDYHDKKIYVPEGRKMSLLQAQALAEHEIGIHLTRHINGLDSPLLLLSSGLNNYLEAEEGLATRAQALIDHKHPSVGGYIGIAHVTGDGAQQKSFREIYNFMKECRAHMYNLQDEKLIEEQAWTRTIRLFRGTTGQTPGACFTRDALYFSGYLKIDALFKNKDPEIKRVLNGKYDPANTGHTELLDFLKI